MSKTSLVHPTQKTALILLVDPPVEELCRKTIEGMGHVCKLAKDQTEAYEILKKEPIDLLVFTIRNKDDDFQFLDRCKKLNSSCRSITIIDESLEEFFPVLLVRGYPRNLIADNHPPDYLELVSTIQKILGNSIFGMDKYKITPHESIKVHSSDQKYALIEKAGNFFASQGTPPRIIQSMQLVLNELLMNAIFDAPVDARGRQIYYHLDRSAVFTLGADEQPTLEYGMNDNHLAIAVIDPFGTFQQKTFFSCVNRCFVEKSIKNEREQSAGIGLFMAFKAITQLVINVAKGRKTEFIAFVDRNFSAGELKKRKRSFHYFTEE